MSLATKLTRAGTACHVALYRSTRGRLGGRMGRRQIGLLTTTGRRTGKQRTTPLMTFEHGADVVVIASNGGSDRVPSWYGNLTADPRVTLEVAGTRRAMTARTATADERPAIWQRVTTEAHNFAGYETRTAREIPVVILEAAAR
jgi:F420H(2)-dependent quinone reductase